MWPLPRLYLGFIGQDGDLPGEADGGDGTSTAQARVAAELQGPSMGH